MQPNTEDAPENLNAEYKKLVREALFLWRKERMQEQSAWLLETVKTLALVNSAGLAGVSAILASTGTAETILSGYPAAAYFALGLLMALLNMYANARGEDARSVELFRRIKLLDDRKLDARIALDDVTGGNRWFGAATTSGWLSAILFLSGAWPFIRAAFGQISSIVCGK
jgi:hypothetical protein